MNSRKMTEEELDEALSTLSLRDAAKVRRHINALTAEAEGHDLQAQVRQFHAALGDAGPEVPAMPDKETRRLRCRLLLEETEEYLKACGFQIAMYASDGKVVLGGSGDSPDFVAMAQENTDVLYVAMGNACAMGVKASEMFTEVHAANMRKVGPAGVVARRADGKVFKPEGW